MTRHLPARDLLLRSAAFAALVALSGAVAAATPPAKGHKPAHRPAAAAGKHPAKKAVAPVETGPAEATAEQIDAAERVYYGVYDCEFKQTVDIEKNPKYPAYVNVKSGKSAWVMKPVLSSTGAIRLEDVKGETLMVQISSKSMLLNVKTAHRVVDDCVSPKQRELIEAARIAKAAEAGTNAASSSALLVAPAEAGTATK